MGRQLGPQLLLLSARLPSALPWSPQGLDTWWLSHSEHGEACFWAHWFSWGMRMDLCRDQRD